MKTTYLIWKNPSCNGVDPVWQEITGKEFIALVRSPEGKNRYFVTLPSTDNDGMDGAIVMETAKADYLDWKREKNHADYLRSYSDGITVVSYHAMESDDGECFGEELLPDYESDIEARYLNSCNLGMILASITIEERRLVEYLYLSDKRGTLCGYEGITGVSKSTVDRRKNAVIKKLRKLFDE